MRTYALVLLCLSLGLSPAWAQDPISFQTKYQTAKSLLEQERYGLAVRAFEEIAQPVEGNRFAAYAAFFQGYAAWKDGQTELAQRTWEALSSTYPDWRDQQEVGFWQGAILFAKGDWAAGSKIVESLRSGPGRDALATAQAFFLLQETDVRVLTQWFEEYSDNRDLAVHLANCIVNQPMVQQNQTLLEFLIRDFELDPTAYNRITAEQSVKKEVYRVAVILPFVHEIFADRKPTAIPDFFKGILGMYEGVRMAVDALDSLGMPIELVAYDTKRDSATTAQLLENPEMRSIDLIIGPLWPGPRAAVQKFSEDNRIIMVNPLSANSDAIGSNPFGFLISPSIETRARKVADYFAPRDPDSTAFVFYGTRMQDSLYAYAYKSEMELRGFAVPLVMKVDEERAQAGFEFLTKTIRYYDLRRTDSARADEVFQEILRERRDNPDLRIDKYEVFDIPHDSIGHILVASENGLIAASIVGAAQTRFAEGDSIPVVGTEEWLLQDYDYVTYEQLERLGVILTAPTYFEKNTEATDDFQEAYIRRQRQLPLREAYTGYEMMWFLGTMLHTHGTYFQFGMQEEGLVPGIFMQGFDYRASNDNQVVPLLRFRDYRFEVIDTTILDEEE